MLEGAFALDANMLTAWIAREIDLAHHFTAAAPALPVPVLQEACQGWILAIGKAEQRRREDLAALYLDRLADLVEFTRVAILLRYTVEAQAIYRSLTPGRGNRGRNDLRIAAICLAHRVPLLTRNLSDFTDIPGLQLLPF